MLDYKHRQHRHERPQKFLQGGRSRYFAFRFQVADDTMQMLMDVHKTLYPFYHHQENACAMLRQHSHKCASSATIFLFTLYKAKWLTAISSHCLVALTAKDVAFSSGMRQNAYCRNLKWIFVAMVSLRNNGQF